MKLSHEVKLVKDQHHMTSPILCFCSANKFICILFLETTHRLWKNLWLLKGTGCGGEEWTGDWHMNTEVCGMIGQWGPASSTEHSTQYSVVIYVGKESEREWMYVHV